MAPAPTRIAILAGGSGTRFWPAGTATKPKQLLALDGDDERPLLRATVDRLKPLSKLPPYIVAPKALKRELTKLLPELPAEAFLWEPIPRNTCAAVALAAHAAQASSGDGPLVVIPADQHVSPLKDYRATLRAMAERARRFEGIVCLGLKPTHAATGYGYLELGKRTAKTAAGPVHHVRRYVEKPSRPRAGRMVKAGNFKWNGGTFAFRPSVFLHALDQHQSDVAWPLARACSRIGTKGFAASLSRAYKSVPSISVDYAVMEKARAVEALAAGIQWDDLGSWDAVARHRAADDDGNRLRGDVTVVDAKDCLVDSEDGHVALLGVKDLVVVRRGRNVLVAKRGRGESVRDVVARLEEEGRKDLLR
ncbi:MAG: sugar phosphate nucleotidyltransferase [Planctomycetota bacterium]|nr:sugar phosphate nucleotidyltransferase [Planctomycetota bacterium]